jgi:hypothetical protein
MTNYKLVFTNIIGVLNFEIMHAKNPCSGELFLYMTQGVVVKRGILKSSNDLVFFIERGLYQNPGLN